MKHSEIIAIIEARVDQSTVKTVKKSSSSGVRNVKLYFDSRLAACAGRNALLGLVYLARKATIQEERADYAKKFGKYSIMILDLELR